jgi:hypothetical protein
MAARAGPVRARRDGHASLGSTLRRTCRLRSVAQLLAHIDTLDLAIAMLDEKVEAMLAPHKQIVELLCTIP